MHPSTTSSASPSASPPSASASVSASSPSSAGSASKESSDLTDSNRMPREPFRKDPSTSIDPSGSARDDSAPQLQHPQQHLHARETSRNSSPSTHGSRRKRDREDFDSSSGRIACIACRTLHKKCDRSGPPCDRCRERGTECVYESGKSWGRRRTGLSGSSLASSSFSMSASDATPSVMHPHVYGPMQGHPMSMHAHQAGGRAHAHAHPHPHSHPHNHSHPPEAYQFEMQIHAPKQQQQQHPQHQQQQHQQQQQMVHAVHPHAHGRHHAAQHVPHHPVNHPHHPDMRSRLWQSSSAPSANPSSSASSSSAVPVPPPAGWVDGNAPPVLPRPPQDHPHARSMSLPLPMPVPMNMPLPNIMRHDYPPGMPMPGGPAPVAVQMGMPMSYMQPVMNVPPGMLYHELYHLEKYLERARERIEYAPPQAAIAFLNEMRAAVQRFDQSLTGLVYSHPGHPAAGAPGPQGQPGGQNLPMGGVPSDMPPQGRK